MNFAFYDDQGTITSILMAPSEAEARLQGGRYVPIAGDAPVDDTTHFVSQGRVLPKKPLDPRYTTRGLEVVFTGLPAGIQMRVGDDSLLSDGGTDVIAFEVPGTYEIDLLGSAPYLDTHLEVTLG